MAAAFDGTCGAQPIVDRPTERSRCVWPPGTEEQEIERVQEPGRGSERLGRAATEKLTAWRVLHTRGSGWRRRQVADGISDGGGGRRRPDGGLFGEENIGRCFPSGIWGFPRTGSEFMNNLHAASWASRITVGCSRSRKWSRTHGSDRWAARQASERFGCNAENCIGRRESDWRKQGLPKGGRCAKEIWCGRMRTSVGQSSR